MSDSALRKTPLHAIHQKAGARFAPFAGYDMPVQYSGILDEHAAVRTAAGLFDVAHMGVARLTGPDAAAALDRAVTRDLSKVTMGQAAYTLLCFEHGGTVDDLIVYRAGPDDFFLVLNASNKEKDVAHFNELFKRESARVELKPLFDEIALLALQGPAAGEILKKAGWESTVPALPAPFAFVEARVAGIPVRVATTGYTGESGCELFVESTQAAELWERLVRAGAPLGLKPAGLGARDTLRTEMGYSLYGHELSDSINPVEAGLSWAVGWQKPAFAGKAALAAAKAAPRRRLVALTNRTRQAPRAGMRVFDAQGADVGEVTSGTFSPTLGHAIGLALVAATAVAPYAIDIRGTRVPFESTTRPFLKRDLKKEKP